MCWAAVTRGRYDTEPELNPARGDFAMPTSDPEGEAIRVRVSSGNPLVDSAQQITMRVALDRAIDLLADCFDSCNRPAEPGSVFARQSDA